MKKPAVDDLIQAIEASKGNVSRVARHYRRARSTVNGWIEASAQAKQALEDARETRVDVAEEVVYKATAEETLQAAFYILNNDPRAKARGWGPKVQQEVSGPDGGELRIIIDR